ncbi:MAG TPA: MBL fold metallo-hydrolase, partial [Verrucomicrobiota bacterium]|nr:MBL fold metallo-hydrolase [Verrucomicrobiota bacterium]
MGPLTPLFRAGCVWLPRLGLWLDPHAPQAGPERVFVSHAHSDHIGDHREVILSEVTARLMAARLPGERVEHRLAFGERREFAGPEGAWHVTLVPAGHIFGSAMAFLEAGGETLLYTGDFKLRPGLSAEPCAPRPADTLVMETTYGRPEYRFPPTADVMAGVVRFCREALDNDETPVLLGYSLGKSQEILRGLSDAGLPLALHPQVARLTRIYEECGQAFPPYGTAADADARGKVIIAPPGANLAALFRRLGPVRQAVLTGWAVNPGSAFRSRADAAFPLSDHADFPDLVEFVRRVAPRRVFTLHGFAADFAAHLRTLGYEAFALSESDQLELSIVVAPPVPATVATVKPAAAPARPAAPGSFRAFAETCAAIGATTSKLEKTARLAAHLRAVPPAELAAVTTWCTGAAFPPADGRTLQAGWSVIRRAVCEVAGVPEPAFRQTYLKHSDTGATVAELLAGRAPAGPPLTIADVIALFDALAAARGLQAKSALLAAAFRRADADEARFLVKIITGDLRIGLKEGLVE